MYDINHIKDHPAYKYARTVADGKIVSGKYILLACHIFVNDIEKMNDEDFEYFLDVEKVEMITGLTKLINMATGLKAGEPAYDSLAGFQWFFIINALCWRFKSNPEKRRYEKSVLLIARKSGKSFLVALIFILLLLTEPEYSEFYSVAPDRELSSIVKKELQQQIEKSPMISKYFKITQASITCTLTNSKFVALANSDNRMDGRKANVFVADEVGALKNRYPIDSMQSSQMNMVNRTGILISTAYESLSNPMTEEVEYAERVLEGLIEDETLFALLYKPDDPKDWMSDDELLRANPLAIDIPDNLDYLRKQRAQAIEMPSKQKNFKTKHMNIFVDGAEVEVYISSGDLIKCRVKLDKSWWKGRDVFLGVDLSLSTDNTAVAMVTYDYDDDCYYAMAWGFYPEDKEYEKSRLEGFDYTMAKERKEAFPCGDVVIDYGMIEEFVMKLPEKYGVNILDIGYDRYNAISSANRWKNAGYSTTMIKQHSSELHAPAKLIKESVLKNRFKYESSQLLEINFANAREVTDTNLNTYINKKKSKGKIDLVFAILNAMCLWNKEVEENKGEELEEIRVLDLW